jgi:CheY-like chemotaxis protein
LRRYTKGGIEALRSVRAASIDMPIIALTASVEPDELQVEPGICCLTRHEGRVESLLPPYTRGSASLGGLGVSLVPP